MVIGVAILQPPSDFGTTGYVATEMAADVAAFYDADVQGTLNGTSAEQLGAIPTAEGTISAPAGAATYTLAGYHSLESTYLSDDEADFLDVMDFSNRVPCGDGGPSGLEDIVEVCSPGSTGENQPIADVPISIGYTYVQEAGMPPVIQSITTTGPLGTDGTALTLSSSGTLTILGAYLEAGGSDLNPSVCVAGVCAGSGGQATASGLTLSNVTANSDTQITVSYSVDGQASSVGAHEITVTTNVGQSNEWALNVGDPTPVITAISPASPWQEWSTFTPGMPFTLGIAGTGFGTSPSVTLADGQGNALSGISVSNVQVSSGQGLNATISANVTIGTTYQGGTVTISVASNGYAGFGNGFIQANPNQPQNATTSVLVLVGPLTPPTIVLGSGATNCPNGTNVAPTPQVVYIGQQITFSGCLPAGVQPTSARWSPAVPGAHAVGNYVTNQQSGIVTPVSTAACTPAQPYCDFPSFYWVDSGQRQFTFTYSLASGLVGSATVTFNVYGPAAQSITTQVGSADARMLSGGTMPTLFTVYGLTQPQVPGQQPCVDQPGITCGKLGIIFSTSAPPALGNPGTYSWIQLITRNTLVALTPNGQQTCPLLSVGGATATQASPLLDNNVPYGTQGASLYSVNRPNDTAADAPNSGVLPSWGEAQHLFSAAMYLMWSPGGQNSISVPVASVGWVSGADGINTLVTQANNTNWTVPCAPGSCPTSSPPLVFGDNVAQSFPTWNDYFVNGSVICH